MKHLLTVEMTRQARLSLVLVSLLVFFVVPNAHATLIGTIPDLPGFTVVPGLVPVATAPGTLLATLSVPFVTVTGTSSGTLVSAVYRESGGTLDFYYQATNNTTAPNCGTPGKPACDPLARETNISFLGFSTFLGFRIDGGSLPGGVFVNSIVPPVTGDRNATGNVVGFSFNPPDSAKIQPGQTSSVLVISTDATNFGAGFASLIDGGTSTVAAFEPIGAPASVPEPASLTLTVIGLAGLARHFRKRR